MRSISLLFIRGQTILLIIAALHINDGSSAFAQASDPRVAAVNRGQQLKGSLSPDISNSKAIGRVHPSTEIRLSIGLAMPKSAELQDFIKNAYDPAGPGYRKFLTPTEFTARFAPSSSDYRKVINWAKSQNLKVVRIHPNRLLLDVSGNAANVERAVHVKLEEALRADGSKFYRPDREPMIDLAVPILQITGLDNFERPKHLGGSSPVSTYISADLRKAYLPGSRLSGAGQSIGILAYDGYKLADVAAYRSQAGLVPLAPTNVLVGTATGSPSTTLGAVETVADIELAMAMAPAANVKVYIGALCTDRDSLLNQMASSPLNLQNSTSFDCGLSTTSLGILDAMAAQGQSFFVPSGDQGGYTSNHQSYDVAKVTVVGGTTLTMNGAGLSYLSEAPWDDPTFFGPTSGGSSGGGVEFQIPIPPYQANTTFTTGSGASTTNRNDPDVSMVARDLYIVSTTYASPVNGWAGTSASVPLWAGFMALVNEQYAHVGFNAVGWASPAIWGIGRSTAYASAFNDIASGAATSYIPGGITHSAVQGYDLATGWGTPKTALIDQMACVTMNSTGGLALSTPPNCDSLATSWGDPHITTFDGMLYDFQAAGEFLAVSTGPSFAVQVRQQWAPNWPNVAINKAVAMQMGKTRVAVLLDPTRLAVDGKMTPLDDGKSLLLPDSVEVTRTGSVYVIRARAGTVRAEAVNSAWVGGDFLNLTVALRNPPGDKMRGIFGNRNGSVDDDIVMRDGTALAQPVSFDDLHHRYADSLRIHPRESLFAENSPTASGAESGNASKAVPDAPVKPFFANNLAPGDYKPARAACRKAGVKVEALLDACTLDVAVFGSPKLAKMYAGVIPPVAVMKPGSGLRKPSECVASCVGKPATIAPTHASRRSSPTKENRDNK
jgi:hypothetical protein